MALHRHSLALSRPLSEAVLVPALVTPCALRKSYGAHAPRSVCRNSFRPRRKPPRADGCNRPMLVHAAAPKPGKGSAQASQPATVRIHRGFAERMHYLGFLRLLVYSPALSVKDHRPARTPASAKRHPCIRHRASGLPAWITSRPWRGRSGQRRRPLRDEFCNRSRCGAKRNRVLRTADSPEQPHHY